MLAPALLRALSLSTVLGLALALTPGCSGDDADAMALDTSVPLLDAFSFDTGPLPASGPVQVSLVVSGRAAAKVHLPAVASASGGAPSLYANGAGTIDVSGAFVLDGTLKVDQPGVPSYDGDLPGLADVRLPFRGAASIDGFAIDSPATVSAAIEPGDLPPIPLPGGIPGHLRLSVAKGSSVDVALQGTCAGVDGRGATGSVVDGATAEYRGAAVRGGSVNLAVAVDIDLPIVGTQTFDVGTVTVPLPESTFDVRASREPVALADAPAGASPAPSCAAPAKGHGGGGGSDGGHGATSSATSGGAAPCESDSDCGDDEACTTKATCAPLRTVCINGTAVVHGLTLVAGDREFGGNGPSVHVSVTPYAADGDLRVAISVKMEELGGDGSVGEASGVVDYPSEGVYVEAVQSGSFSWSYVDDDTTVDDVSDLEAPVMQVRCMGDTSGEDICDEAECSYCEIDLGCFVVITRP